MARGTVKKDVRGWYIRYDAGEDAATGRRTQRYKGGFPTQQDAETALALALADVARKEHRPPSTDTVATVAAAWLADVQVRGTSHNRYSTVVHDHLLPALGHRKMQALQPTHVRAFYRDCVDDGLAASTIRTFHARLTQICTFAVHRQLIARTIMDEVRPPKAEPPEFEVWTIAQLRTFLRATADEPYGRLWHVAGMTGLRRGELLGLRWKDVDLTGGSLTIRVQAIREYGAVQLRGLKTARSKRTIPLDGGTLAVLRLQRTTVNEEWMRHRKTWHDHDLVFPYVPGRLCDTAPGEPMRPGTASSYWCWRVRRTDLPPIRLHDVRHAHATHLLQLGVPVHIVAARLGHSPTVLLSTYAHSIFADQQEAVVARLEMAYN